jgi:hypothetical protein
VIAVARKDFFDNLNSKSISIWVGGNVEVLVKGYRLSVLR